MLRRVLEHMLVGPAGLLTVGLPLLIAGSHRLLFARLSNVLSDGDGLRMGLDWKGASSLKPCFKHVNVFMKDRTRHASATHTNQSATRRFSIISFIEKARSVRLWSLLAGFAPQDSGLAHLRPGYVDITCCDRTMIKDWTSDKIFRAVDLLEAASRRVQEHRMTRADYNELEMATGLNRNPEGILASRVLRSSGRSRHGAHD